MLRTQIRSGTTLLLGASESGWGTGLTHRTTESAGRCRLLTQHQAEGCETLNGSKAPAGQHGLCMGSICRGADVGDDKGEGLGGRKCRSFQGRKMGDSANDFLVNLTSTQVGSRKEF